MTTKDDKAVKEELAALGEAPDLPWAPALDGGGDVDDDPDVRTVATLVAISRADLSGAPLSELSKRRVWARLEGRLAAATPAAVVVSDPEAPAANSGPSWRSVVAGLAVAAVLILPRISTAPDPAPAASPAERAAVESLGRQARQSVAALGDQGGERARDLASTYATRLSDVRDGGSRP